jgi:hypothetical protein
LPSTYRPDVEGAGVLKVGADHIAKDHVHAPSDIEDAVGESSRRRVEAGLHVLKRMSRWEWRANILKIYQTL